MFGIGLMIVATTLVLGSAKSVPLANVMLWHAVSYMCRLLIKPKYYEQELREAIKLTELRVRELKRVLNM